MSRRGSRKRKTDYGTVLLHGCLVVALAIAVLTGLRIAAESPGRTWINAFDLILPRHLVWTAHMQVALALIASNLLPGDRFSHHLACRAQVGFIRGDK